MCARDKQDNMGKKGVRVLYLGNLGGRRIIALRRIIAVLQPHTPGKALQNPEFSLFSDVGHELNVPMTIFHFCTFSDFGYQNDNGHQNSQIN